jgi:hypothetical protein
MESQTKGEEDGRQMVIKDEMLRTDRLKRLTRKGATHKCIRSQGARGVLRIRIHLVPSRSALVPIKHHQHIPVIIQLCSSCVTCGEPTADL